MDVSLYNIGFKGAARYPAKYMGESSFYDYVIFPLYYEKITCHNLHFIVNFAGYLAVPIGLKLLVYSIKGKVLTLQN